MKILCYDGKHEREYYDISTPEQEAAAYMRLFLEFDHYWQFYADFEDIEPLTVCEPCLKDLHRHCEKDNCVCPADSCKSQARAARQRGGQEQEQKALYDKARAGDSSAAKKLIQIRKDGEYEGTSVIHINDSVKALEEYKRGMAKEKKC